MARARTDTRTQPPSTPEPSKPKPRTNPIVELVVIVAAALLIAFLVQRFIVKTYKIPSGSMEPTLQIGQRVLVDRIGTHFSGPHVGQIVVFHPPKGAEQEGSEEAPICGASGRPVVYGKAACSAPVPHEASVNFIKRIVAGPGDRIFIREGHVYRNGVREHDPYIAPCESNPECDFTVPITIPPGHWFMMGDNRGNSDDSRFWGPVPTGWIIGDAFATYWPLNRIGFL